MLTECCQLSTSSSRSRVTTVFVTLRLYTEAVELPYNLWHVVGTGASVVTPVITTPAQLLSPGASQASRHCCTVVTPETSVRDAPMPAELSFQKV